MTQKEFNTADEIEQINLIQMEGLKLGEAKEEQYTILLYKVGSFYVEMYYERSFRMLKHIKSFSYRHECHPVFSLSQPPNPIR